MSSQNGPEPSVACSGPAALTATSNGTSKSERPPKYDVCGPARTLVQKLIDQDREFPESTETIFNDATIEDVIAGLMDAAKFYQEASFDKQEKHEGIWQKHEVWDDVVAMTGDQLSTKPKARLIPVLMEFLNDIRYVRHEYSGHIRWKHSSF